MRQLDFTLAMIDRISRPLRQAKASLSGFAEGAKTSFTQIGTGAAAMWGIAQSIKSVLGPAYEMDAVLGEVGSLGVAENTLKKLSVEALNLSVQYGKSATDIVRSSYAIKGAMGGLAEQDLPRVTVAANTLAAGVRASGEEAGAYMGAMAARFRSELDSIGHIEFAEQLAGKTAYMVKNFGVSMQTMQGLIEGTKNAGADFGVSLNEQFAVLGELSRTMGTESSGMYEQFLRSAPAAAQKLGMSFVDATGKLLPMGDILQKIQDKFGTNIAGNVKAQQKLDEAFGGGSDVIKKLIDRQGQLNKSIAELGRNDGMKQAQEMAERMADPWERLTALWYSMRVAIGNTLLPVLNPLIDRLTEGGKTLTRWLNMFPNIAKWIGYITVGILSLGAAGAVLTIVAGLFSLLSSPIILIIAALGVLGWAVYDQYKYWKWAFGEIGKDLVRFWENIVSVWGGVAEYFSGIWKSITLGWEMVVNFFAGLSPVAAFEGFASTIKGVFSRLFDMLKSTFASSYNWIVEKLNKIPGIDIDLKTTSSAPSVAAGAAGPSLLTGERVGSSIPRGGLMRQVNKESKTTIDRSSRIDTVNFVMPNGMTPAQLAEWQEIQAG